jgi:hypothetical protein
VKVILLDGDGVMIPYPNGPGDRPQYFSANAIEALKQIFERDPEIRVVLSTSMRCNDRDLRTFYRMWASGNLPADRIHGNLPMTGSLHPNRQYEINEYKRINEAWNYILPLDDELLFDVLYYKIHSCFGLRTSDVDVILRFFEGEPMQVQNEGFGFGLSYIKDPSDSL